MSAHRRSSYGACYFGRAGFLLCTFSMQGSGPPLQRGHIGLHSTNPFTLRTARGAGENIFKGHQRTARAVRNCEAKVGEEEPQMMSLTLGSLSLSLDLSADSDRRLMGCACESPKQPHSQFYILTEPCLSPIKTESPFALETGWDCPPFPIECGRC